MSGCTGIIKLRTSEAFGNCLKGKHLNVIECSQICKGCVWFFITLFDSELFTF